MSKRQWFQLHSYTGVFTGLMLFVICWSGTFAVVSNEIDWLVTPEMRVEASGGLKSWQKIYEAVETAYPQASIKSMSAPLNTVSTATVLVAFPEQKRVHVYIDPYTAAIQGRAGYFNVQRFFRDFHRKLFAPGPGGYLVQVFSLVLLTSFVAALFFYKRWWQGFLRYPRPGRITFWSEVHKFIGAWCIWFLVIISITAGWFLYEKAQRDLFDGPVRYAGGVEPIPLPMSDPALPVMHLDDLIAIAQVAWPEFDIRKIVFKPSSTGLKTLVLEGNSGFPLVRDRANQMHLDVRTGEILWRNGDRDLPAYWLWSNMADPLHFGFFAGLPSKAVWFSFGLALSGLILSGTWLHVRRIMREAGDGPRRSRPAALAASFTSLGILCLSIPYGVAEAHGYGPMIKGVRHFPDMAPGVLAFIAAWIFVTLSIVFTWTTLLWCLQRRPDKLPPLRAET